MAFFSKVIGSQKNSFILTLRTTCLQLEQRGLSDYNKTVCHFVLQKMLLYLHIVNHKKSTSRLQKHLGMIILHLKIRPAASLARSQTNMSAHTQITDSLTVCGPLSDIHSQLYDVGIWSCPPDSNSNGKKKQQQSVPCKMRHVRVRFIQSHCYHHAFVTCCANSIINSNDFTILAQTVMYDQCVCHCL